MPGILDKSQEENETQVTAEQTVGLLEVPSDAGRLLLETSQVPMLSVFPHLSDGVRTE